MPLTNWEGLLENIAFSWGNVFCPVLIRYLLNVNKILRRFTSRNKGIWNWFVLIKVHKRPIPDKEPPHECTLLTGLDTSSELCHHLPQRPQSGLQKEQKSVCQSCLELSVFCRVMLPSPSEGKGAHCVPVWAICHLAKSMIVNKVSRDRVCQKCLSSGIFVIAHNSKLFTIYVFPYLRLIKL